MPCIRLFYELCRPDECCSYVGVYGPDECCSCVVLLGSWHVLVVCSVVWPLTRAVGLLGCVALEMSFGMCYYSYTGLSKLEPKLPSGGLSVHQWLSLQVGVFRLRVVVVTYGRRGHHDVTVVHWAE